MKVQTRTGNRVFDQGVGVARRPARHRENHDRAPARHRRYRHFVAFSALTSGVKELCEMINDARRRRDHQTVLFIYEVHHFSKTQQDALLGAVEDRLVLLVAATTENPSFSECLTWPAVVTCLGFPAVRPSMRRSGRV
ncbi:hypothetical protein JOF56_009439 [Kibdelosporangium banguiense]|uniref:AAA domain-containing protein n=1 Tax=Kibdelosporangium banguiense TaxID=1365924 RepID=A0ABS4TXD6_9PSEU|nr:hypothetical protein [Kibdelosporangium banguiense]